jgi:hypothetical protein
MQKKKIEVVKAIDKLEDLHKYLSPEYRKIVGK